MREHLGSLALAGLGLELVFVLSYLRPLALWRHPDVIYGYQALATVFGVHRDGAIRFVLAILAAYAFFVLATLLARRVAGRAGCWLVLAFTVLFSLTLLPTNPAGAQDVYHNVADARTQWVYGQNPAVTSPDAHPDDAFFPFVPVWRDFPSAYGPLWYDLAGLPLPLAGARLWPNVIGQKVLTAAFLVGTTALVMLIVGRIRPGLGAVAGVLVGWNPLMVFETAGNAHNDIVMVFFTLWAFFALSRRRWLAVFPFLAVAVSVKYVLVLLAPIVLLWMLRRREIPRRHVALSLALGLALGLALYAPSFADGAVLDSLTREGDHILASPGSALVAFLMEQRQLGYDEATQVMKLALGALFVFGYVALLASIRRDPSLRALATTSAWAVFLFLLIAKWWFWPWYLTWLVPLAALAPSRRIALIASVFSASAMLMYVAYYWRVYDDWHDTQISTAAVIFVPPLLLAAAHALTVAVPRVARRRALRIPSPAIR